MKQFFHYLARAKRVFVARWKRRRAQRNGHRVVFVDGGAHNGQVIREHLDPSLNVLKNSFMLPDLRGAQFHFFEPNPLRFAELKETCAALGHEDVVTHQKALGGEDGVTTLFPGVGEWGDLATTIYRDSTEKLDEENAVEVEVVDFTEFIRKNFEPDDYVIVKLDVEGAEYDIIPKLMESGVINFLDELYIEWHDEFFPDRASEGEKLRQQLKKYRNVCIRTWYY